MIGMIMNWWDKLLLMIIDWMKEIIVFHLNNGFCVFFFWYDGTSSSTEIRTKKRNQSERNIVVIGDKFPTTAVTTTKKRVYEWLSIDSSRHAYPLESLFGSRIGNPYRKHSDRIHTSHPNGHCMHSCGQCWARAVNRL